MGNLALDIASSGLASQQVALQTVAENLANANTPGYVVETANIVTNPATDALGVGDGARVTGVTQANDELLVANSRQAQGALAQSTALQQSLTAAQSVFPEPSANGISATLANFWQSWDSIVQNPSAPAARTQVVDLAQNLATQFQQASIQLTNLSSNAQSQLSSIVGQATTQLADVAQLNGQIVATEGTGAPANSLIDQRNQLLDNLAGSIGAHATPQTDGTVSLSVGGVTLVQGTWADKLALTGTAGSVAIESQTAKLALPTSSGTAAGLLGAVNQYLPQYQSQLDSVANALASTVNQQLATGYAVVPAGTTLPNGTTTTATTTVPGSDYPLFTGSGAAGISVAANVAANPQLLAASATPTLPDATNDGGNAQAMANLGTLAGGPDETYRSLIQNLGAQVSAVNGQVQAQTSVANTAQANLQSVTGVSTDSQMVQMLTYQQAYQASAKVISTVDTAIQSLLNAV